MQRTAILNGSNVNFDKDYSLPALASLRAWVVEGLEVTANSVSIGKGLIQVRRTSVTPNEIFYIVYESTTAVTIDTSGDKKVFIQIPKSNLNDPGYNQASWEDIATIQTATDYPTEDYIALASITGGVITDERVTSTISAKNIAGEKIALEVKTGGDVITFIKANGDLAEAEVSKINAIDDIQINGAGINEANGLLKLNALGKIDNEYLEVSAEVENILIKNLIPGESLAKMSDPVDTFVGSQTSTTDYLLKSGTIGQTFTMPSYLIMNSGSLFINYGSYSNAHVKEFRFRVYESIAKAEIIYDYGTFNWNDGNNTTKEYPVPADTFKAGVEYYAEIEVTNVYSTSYYSRVRYDNTNPYSAGKMYIDGVESVGNSMRMYVDYSFQ